MARVIEYRITEENDGLKIYTFLKSKNKFSDRLIRTLKTNDSGITLNGEHARTVDILKPGDLLTVSIPEEDSEIEAVDINLDIVYEDQDVLVINKPPTLAMHPSHNHQGDTLANGVVAHLKRQGKHTAYKAVGRLDKGTSGIVVCALNQLAACKLNGKVKKEYSAIVKGSLEDDGTVDIPIYRPDPMITLRACSYEKGEETAITHWHVIKRYKDATEVVLNLETGRTHQIRVHMSYIGHPLAGDSFYGDFRTEIGHQLLHCRKCSFIHPVTGEVIELYADPPREYSLFDE